MSLPVLQPGPRDRSRGGGVLSRSLNASVYAAAWAAGLLSAGLMLTLVGWVLIRAWPRLTPELVFSVPGDAGRTGGVAPMLVNTLLVLGVCLVVTLPLGLLLAAGLDDLRRQALQTVPRSNTQNTFYRIVRPILGGTVDVLAATPSIVFGMFGMVFFGEILGLGVSILTGGLTLSLMALPLFVRAAEQGLRMVPAEQIAAATALSLTRWTTFRRLMLPAASPAVAAGAVLAIGRALAETAALLFTTGFSTRFPSALDDQGRVLSVHVYILSTQIPDGEASAAASAAVLLVLLLAINGLAAALIFVVLPRLNGHASA